MKWTADKPTEIGWYWGRSGSPHDKGTIVHVYGRQYCGALDLYIMLGTKHIRVNEIEGEWAGPIERPTS